MILCIKCEIMIFSAFFLTFECMEKKCPHVFLAIFMCQNSKGSFRNSAFFSNDMIANRDVLNSQERRKKKSYGPVRNVPIPPPPVRQKHKTGPNEQISLIFHQNTYFSDSEHSAKHLLNPPPVYGPVRNFKVFLTHSLREDTH